MKCKIDDYKVSVLPPKGQPNSRYYVPNGNGTDIDEYITDKDGIFHKVNPAPPPAPPVVPASAFIKSQVVLGESVGGGFLVYISGGTAYKYNQNNLSLYDKSVGITNQAGTSGQTVDIITFGECAQLGGLTAGNVYYATNAGLISATPPASNILQPVGVAKSATTLWVNIQKPYVRI